MTTQPFGRGDWAATQYGQQSLRAPVEAPTQPEWIADLPLIVEDVLLHAERLHNEHADPEQVDALLRHAGQLQSRQP